jgi:hypothetical protein
MALEKVENYDYQVTGKWNAINERKRVAVEEDGVEISFSYHSTSWTIGDDVSSARDEVRALTASFWTPAVSASRSLYITSQSLGL